MAVSLSNVTVTLAPRAKRRYIVTRDGLELGRIVAAPNGWQATPAGGTTSVHLTIEQATVQIVGSYQK